MGAMIQLCVGLLFLFASQLGVQPAIYDQRAHLTPESSSRLAWCHPSARSSDLGQGWNYGYDKGGRLESVEQNGTLRIQLSEGSVTPPPATVYLIQNLSRAEQPTLALQSFQVDGRQVGRQVRLQNGGDPNADPADWPQAGDQVRFLVSTAAFVDGFGNRSLGFDSGTVDWPGDDGILFDETAPRLEEICAQAGILKVTFSEPVSVGLAAGTITIDGASPSWSQENGGYTLSLSLSDGQHVIDIGTGALDLAGYGVSQAAHQSFNIDTTTTKSIFSAPFPGEVGDSLVGNPYGFQGLPEDSETGFLYVRNRYYDPELGRFITPDPMGYADGPNQYQFALNDPIVNRDPSGNIVETAWDVLNIGMGLYSGYQNIKAGNYGLAAFDALGVVVDTVAALVPFVPGGVGASLKAARCGQAFQKAQLVVRTADVAQGAGGAALAHIEGNDGQAAFNAGMAALGAAGMFRKNPCNCFGAGTLVASESGFTPIEEIRTGDRVWSLDEATGESSLREVINTFRNDGRPTYELDVKKGDGGVDTIEVTGEHPFWVDGQGWVAAEALSPGDHLRANTEAWLEVLQSLCLIVRAAHGNLENLPSMSLDQMGYSSLPRGYLRVESFRVES